MSHILYSSGQGLSSSLKPNLDLIECTMYYMFIMLLDRAMSHMRIDLRERERLITIYHSILFITRIIFALKVARSPSESECDSMAFVCAAPCVCVDVCVWTCVLAEHCQAPHTTHTGARFVWFNDRVFNSLLYRSFLFRARLKWKKKIMIMEEAVLTCSHSHGRRATRRHTKLTFISFIVVFLL